MAEIQDLYTRSRGDFRADNSRLRDVATCAARMVDLYSFTDTEQRFFTVEPVAAWGPFRDLDVCNAWRSLFEALIVAGTIERDHLGLPLAVGNVAYLRLQAWREEVPGMAEGWDNRAWFQVVPGAGSYAMADAEAVALYYQDTGRAVRIVRDVLPVAARAEYEQGARDQVLSSDVVGMIEAGAVLNLQTGYAAISDATENPDGEVLGSAFWPARIVLQGVPGPQGPAGPAGGGGPVARPMAAAGGGLGGYAFTVDVADGNQQFIIHLWIDGVEQSTAIPMGYGSAAAAVDAGMLWLHDAGQDAELYAVTFDAVDGPFMLNVYQGGVTVDAGGAVTGYGVPDASYTADGFDTIEEARALALAWQAGLTLGGAGGGTGGYAFTVDAWLEGVGFVLHTFIDGVEVNAESGQNYDTRAAALNAGVLWLQGAGQDAGVYLVIPTLDGEYMAETFTGGAVVEGGALVSPGVQVFDLWVTDVAPEFVAEQMGEFLAPFVFSGLGPVPAWVAAQVPGAVWHLVEQGAPYWQPLPGVAGDAAGIADAGADWCTRAGDPFYQYALRVVGEAADLGAAAAGLQALAGAGDAAGGWGYAIVNAAAGQVVARRGLSAAGVAVAAWDAAENTGAAWSLVDQTVAQAGGTVGGAGRYWVQDWAGRDVWGRSYLALMGQYGGAALDTVGVSVVTPGAGAVAFDARFTFQVLNESAELLYQVLPPTVAGGTYADWAGHAEAEKGAAYAAAFDFAAMYWPGGGYSIVRRFPSWRAFNA